jgi:hypothetical protein
MSPPQIFDAKALLSKVIRPLLLYSQACLESNERNNRNKVEINRESRGKFNKVGGGNNKPKDQPKIKRQGDPKETVCFKCNEKGHKANNCPKKRPFDKVETQAPNKNDNNKKYKLQMMRSLCSHICDSCCEVRVGDKIFRALLDTGATYSHISPKLLEYAKSCGMAVSETIQVLYVETATGERLPCHRQVELFATLIIPAHTSGLEIRPITIYPLEFPIPDLDLVIGVQDIQKLALWDLLIAINNKRPSWSQREMEKVSTFKIMTEESQEVHRTSLVEEEGKFRLKSPPSDGDEIELKESIPEQLGDSEYDKISFQDIPESLKTRILQVFINYPTVFSDKLNPKGCKIKPYIIKLIVGPQENL